jgi:hypothetical protein
MQHELLAALTTQFFVPPPPAADGDQDGNAGPSLMGLIQQILSSSK